MTAPTEYTTSKGLTLRVGNLFRDNRKSNIRTLRIDHFEHQHGILRAHCTVIRQEYGNQVTEPMRPTAMDAERLGSRSFIPATEAGQ